MNALFSVAFLCSIVILLYACEILTYCMSTLFLFCVSGVCSVVFDCFWLFGLVFSGCVCFVIVIFLSCFLFTFSTVRLEHFQKWMLNVQALKHVCAL